LDNVEETLGAAVDGRDINSCEPSGLHFQRDLLHVRAAVAMTCVATFLEILSVTEAQHQMTAWFDHPAKFNQALGKRASEVNRVNRYRKIKLIVRKGEMINRTDTKQNLEFPSNS